MKLFISQGCSLQEAMHLQVDHGLDVKDVPSVEEVADTLSDYVATLPGWDFDEVARVIIDLFTDTEP